VFVTRRLLATAFTILASAAVTALPATASPLPATAPRAHAAGHRRHRARAKGAHTRCAQKAGRPRRHARLAARGCTAPAHAQREQTTPKPRRSRARRGGEPSAQQPASTAPNTAAQTDAAAIAAALATPCQDTELTPSPENIALVRAAILCLINHKRAENNELPLQTSPQLEQAAEGHCQELIADDYFAHVSPSGETPVDRIRATGYIPGPSDGYVIGENLAWGTYQLSTPQAIVAAWIASPGHLANILEAQYTETGIGVTAAVPASLAEGSPGATYAQEFGVIIQ
jgi:uncharacterized protein YkwD